jgi:hypothetical protein
MLARIDARRRARLQHWSTTDEVKPTPRHARSMVRRTAYKNAAATGALAAVPTWSLLTLPVELGLSLRLTVDMLVDLAVAYEVEDKLDAELLLTLLLAHDTRSVMDLVRIQDDGPTVVKRPGRAMLSKLASLAGRRLMLRIARLALGRVVPVAGAAGLAWWARKRTRAIGHAAMEAFGSDLVFIDVSQSELDEVADRIDRELAAPPELPVDPEVLEARYDLLIDMLRHVKNPSKRQVEALGQIAAQWSDKGQTLPDPAERMASGGRPNLTLLSTQEDAERLLADAAAVGRLGKGVPRDWAYDLGASFGLDQDAVDAILSDPSPSSLDEAINR